MLLPDTTTSARYVSFDAPVPDQGVPGRRPVRRSDFKIDNAQGSAAHHADPGRGRHHQRAPACCSSTPLDSGSGAAIEAERHRQGREGHRLRPPHVKGGARGRTYVSFDNVQGRQADRPGRGRLHHGVERDQAEHPGHGRRPDRQQRHAVRAGLQRRAEAEVRRRHLREGRRAGRHVDALGRARPRSHQQYTAHPNINAVVTPNDDNANAVIAEPADAARSRPRRSRPPARTRRCPGLQNILKGYQCGTVYKPIYLEAQAAAALALYLRAGQTPPAGAGQRHDHGHDRPTTDVPSVLLTPIWVTTANMDVDRRQGRVRRRPPTSASGRSPPRAPRPASASQP